MNIDIVSFTLSLVPLFAGLIFGIGTACKIDDSSPGAGKFVLKGLLATALWGGVCAAILILLAGMPNPVQLPESPAYAVVLLGVFESVVCFFATFAAGLICAGGFLFILRLSGH